ncbi:MAG: NAD(P)/FAD-dependent oxidoreductase [Anaerolineae bacterium]
MKETDALIIGGSAAGVTAAITARRHYPPISITLVRRERQAVVPCGIPYLFGTLGSCDKNLMSDEPLKRNQIDLLVDEVMGIDCAAKTATTAGGEVIRWRRLILATGSRPIMPPIPGVELQGVYTVEKDVDYLGRMLEAVARAQDIVVVGGGLIGLELADELRKRGLNVTVVEVLRRCLELVYDDDITERAEQELARLGINVKTSARAAAIEGDGKVKAVRLDTGEHLRADLVLLSIGAQPNVALAESAGLCLVDSGIQVDRYLRTSNPDVFAAGDCVAKTNYLTGMPSTTKLASVATAEARVAGANLFELRRQFPGVVGVYSTKIGDLAMGLAGLGERAASAAGLSYIVGTAEAADRHPASMPGAKSLKVKLVFTRQSGQLIGGQAYGGDSVGELINLIAVMVQRRMTTEDIATFQMGTHPALTASPVTYQLPTAAEMALAALR